MYAIIASKVDPIRCMDEVDLLLHPLHSELNFPLGGRQPLEPAPQRWGMVMHLFDVLVWASLGVMAEPSILERYSFARELAATVTVMGTAARSGLGKLMLGNTAEDTLTRLEGDVLTVRD